MKTIPVAEFTADLKNGIPDEGLRKKYGLSEDELRRVFDKFLKAVAGGSAHIQVESKE